MDFDYDDNNTNQSSLSHEEKYKILLTMGCGGFVAAIVCVIALGMALVLKLYKYAVHRLAMYQVMGALFFEVTCLLELAFIKYNGSNSFYHSFCSAVGFLIEYALLVKLMFTLCLTFHLFCFSIFHVSLNRLEILHILVSIITPLLFVWIPFINNTYGQAGAWCWITNWKRDQADKKLTIGEIEQYSLLYGPAIVSLSVAVIAVIVIIVVLVHRAYGCCNKVKNVNEQTPLLNEDKHKKVLKEVLPLIAFPVLSFLLYLPAFTNRLVGSISNRVSFISFIWGGLSLPLLSLLAGATLIIHILIIRCSKQKPKPLNDVTTIINVNDAFTTDTIASTAAKTFWEPSQEST